ncbi:cache domain-containing protein [Geobacter sp. AOG2]|uniref:sensor histidine kinase n=1 Tax=Geobacter sp. AOG2 TaxID=1566347 RepID=UPI001CC5218B|nr:cache domain-containing protein [Geobacter sp. AOG2]GFE61844.1 hypothetical protein AOG2_24320 [Geobacter sp. AOG2]
MRSGYFRSLTLKTRMALAIASLFVLFVITTLYLTRSYFEHSFKQTITAQQFSLVSSLADSIDDKLRIAQNALKAAAESAPADAFTNPDKAQRFLDQRVGVLSIFDNGIYFINKDGRLIVESPYRPDRRGRDLGFREWVQKTVTSRKPYISEPYVSTHTPGRPAIVMTMPVFDQKGEMTGMMVGSLDLLGENFLAILSRVKIGATGYIFIVGMNRMLVVHPDRNRILKPAAPPGVNRMVDRAFAGFEGSGETVTSRGVPMLVSIKQMRMAPWFLGADYPQAEAYAPIRNAGRYFVLAAVTGTVLFLLVTWLTMKRLMAPLAVMTRHVAHLPEKQRHEHQIAIDSADEIGVLAAAFNTMIDTLDRQQDELRDQKQRIEDERGLLENEIAERRIAQEALSVKQQQLEALNSLLQRTNSELEKRISQAVSEIRQKDRILIQQQRQAAMGEMINNIAHQWRQPLNNIGLIVQNMLHSQEHGELTFEQMRTDVGKAMETLQFMSQTIDDFRNYFLPDKEKSLFSVKKAVNRTISIIEGSNGKTRISVKSGDGADPVIYGYPNEYSQVLLNVLINARDALSERNIRNPEIRVDIRSEEGKSVVTISDNAGGIPESIIGRIFDPYFSTKSPDKGTGVGLFMSRNIIEGSMNGSLTACNSAEGAEFRIEV